MDEILIKTQFSKVTRDLHKLLFSLQVYPLTNSSTAPEWRHQGYEVKDFAYRNISSSTFSTKISGFLIFFLKCDIVKGI